MTFRERIADWISGGALTFASEQCGHLHAKVKIERYEKIKLRLLLRDIADMETPRANATVKRMAARARDGLK